MDYQTLLVKSRSLAIAISGAEGWPVAGSLPNRIHNPGDMKLGNRGWGTLKGKTIYPKADFGAALDDKTDGASALRRECLAILVGASHIYSPSWTFSQLAVEWTGGDNPVPWCAKVCSEVMSTPETKMSDWLNIA